MPGQEKNAKVEESKGMLTDALVAFGQAIRDEEPLEDHAAHVADCVQLVSASTSLEHLKCLFPKE